MPRVVFYEMNIFIQLQQKKYFHSTKHIYSTLQVPGHRGGHEEEENRISRQFIEWVINHLELAAKFVENALPFVNEREEGMAEVAIIEMILFHSWCRKLGS